jgi:hypothetical protein
MSDETILESVSRKAELFDRSYKTIFPRGLKPEKVFLAWLIAHEVESERTVLLEAYDQASDPVMKAILGIDGTPWGIYVANHLIEHLGAGSTKLTLKRMDSNDFKNALSKYSKRAMELYAEIAVNIVSSDDSTSNARNEIRVRTFLDKLKRNLGIRLTKSSTWKLPKLHGVGPNT